VAQSFPLDFVESQHQPKLDSRLEAGDFSGEGSGCGGPGYVNFVESPKGTTYSPGTSVWSAGHLSLAWAEGLTATLMKVGGMVRWIQLLVDSLTWFCHRNTSPQSCLLNRAHSRKGQRMHPHLGAIGQSEPGMDVFSNKGRRFSLHRKQAIWSASVTVLWVLMSQGTSVITG